MMRNTHWALLVAGAVGLLASPACGEDEPEFQCNVQRYPVRGVAYSETDSYCGSKAACDSYCASLKGNPDVGNCSAESKSYCSGGDVPVTAGAARPFCAIMKKSGCGSSFSDASYEPYCDPHCSIEPGSSESDQLGSTTCYTTYGTTMTKGTSCDDALAKLAGE
jgi:hypothetical protein